MALSAGAGPPVGRREEIGVPPLLRGLVSRLLRTGLVLALAWIAAGLALAIRGGVGLGSTVHAVGLSGGLGPGLLGGAPGAFIFVGLIILLATPLIRVAVSAGLFASVGDRPFTALTLFVLGLLLATLAVGVLR